MSAKAALITQKELSTKMFDLAKNSIVQDNGKKAVDVYKEIFNSIPKNKKK
jgi:hypothetical protein